MTSNEACPVPATATSNALTVSVLQAVHSAFSHSICQGESYPFNAANLTAAGSYNDTLTAAAANGCDSIITLNLTVNNLPVPVITQNGAALSTGNYTWYQWLLNGNWINGANVKPTPLLPTALTRF